MYISCEIEEKDNKRYWHIIDSDFEEFVNTRANGWVALINCYERRNLNISKNLFLALKQYANKSFPKLSALSLLEDIINMKNFPRDELCVLFKKYKNEIEKYSLLE